MHSHKATLFALFCTCLTTAACTLPIAAPTPTPIPLPTATLAPSPVPPSPTPLVAASGTGTAFPTVAPDPVVPAASQAPGVTQVPSATFCADAQATTLINNFKTALQTSNGKMLASLVSPAHGMEARLYRNGTVVTYDQQHAKFLFETTFVVDWGPAPASGQETKGSFHETIIPALLAVFTQNYTLTCNQVQVGGASYKATWPYPGINFYSVYYPGTQANGNQDWRTWLLGMQYVNGQPYLYAIMPFQWEP